MKGALIINGKDAWETWGVKLQKGAYDALLTGAPQKAYLSHSSHAQHGVQYYAEQSKVNERSVQLSFLIKAESTRDYLMKKQAFERELRKGLLTFRTASILTEYKLLLDSFLELNSGNQRTAGIIAARFIEPNPMDRESTLRTAYILMSSNGEALVSDSNEILTRNIK